MKIRTAIFAVYVAASAVGFSVLMRFVLAEVRPRYVTAVRLNLQDSARMVGAALRGRTLADARAALAGESAFRVRLVGTDERILFDSSEPLVPAERDYDSDGAGMAKRAGSRLVDGTANAAELEVSTVAPVALADVPGVRLVLSRSFRSVNAVIWSERKKLAAMGVAIAGMMIVAGWWIAARLTHSLERLAAYVREVRDGRPVSAPRSRVKEIAALGQAFEEMRDAVEGRKHVERYTQAFAHEVKAPLAAIRGAAELLTEEMPPDQRRRFLDNIRSEGSRIQQIVERLLELSSLEARKRLHETENIAGDELMSEAAEIVRPAYAAARVSLIFSSAKLTLRGERVLLREALVNLLQNALEFSPAGGSVEFAVAARETQVVWTVDDNGPGVPDYALPRVFERFYSLPRPGTSRKSTGLGLALVREIAHLHGGEATLANRPGAGARATLSVPGSASRVA
ncbi:MAG: creC [Verrucomicrobia bacterium]|nr:creC [Verrucomicrobiota bacterium]